MMDYSYETQAHSQGFGVVCGVDEAGRGPLAGPVFAAAVILPENYTHDILNDSKKLSEKKRYSVYDDIIRDAVSVLQRKRKLMILTFLTQLSLQ